MKITIIGAGAIGTMLGAILSDDETELSVLTKKEINKDHIILENFKGKTLKKKAKYVNNLDKSDWLILAVKSYDIEKLVEPLKESSGKIMCCQNGIGTYNLLKSEIDNNRLSYMVTGIGSSKIETGKARFEGSGFTFLGEFSSKNGEQISHLSKKMGFSGIDCEIVNNIFSYVWLKTIINSSINPIAAYHKVENGRLREPELNAQVKEMCNESSLIAQKIGIRLPLDPWKETKSIIKNTSNNKCSMLQDIENRNRTEIDAINGEIIRIAEANNLNCKKNKEYLNKIKAITS